MRGGGIIGAIVVIWLIIGAIAAFQRGYFKGDNDANCATAARVALTVVAGPLNYFGVNPKPTCENVRVPQPSASGPAVVPQPINSLIGVTS
jgi:hypothetical protein